MVFRCLECDKEVDYYESDSVYACKKHKDIVEKKIHDEMIANRIDEFESFGAATEDGVVVCPYCFEDATDAAWEIAGLRSDGDTSIYHCEHCRKQFDIELSVTYSYKSTRKE